MSHFVERCIHGKLKSQCRCPGPRTVITVPCEDVPECSVGKNEPKYSAMLTLDEMRFIRGAMAGMGTLPIAQSVRDALNESETKAMIMRGAYDAVMSNSRHRPDAPGDTSERIPD